MNNPLLCLRQLVLSRGALPELTLDFAAGVHLIVGPNGIGKTSLLNCIAGTLPPRSGTLTLDDQPLKTRSAAVVLAPNMPPDISWIRARLLFDFVVSLYPASRVAPDEAESILVALNLPPNVDAPLGTLSAGTARKLMLAAALAARPPVMLFDEPTNEIDAAASDAFRTMIAAIAPRHVVLITTHHASDLASLGGQVLDLAALQPALMGSKRGVGGR
ncbi:MAG: ATP-binding cassette domain-containing protein [Pseudomonadota bacterium]